MNENLRRGFWLKILRLICFLQQYLKMKKKKKKKIGFEICLFSIYIEISYLKKIDWLIDSFMCLNYETIGLREQKHIYLFQGSIYCI